MYLNINYTWFHIRAMLRSYDDDAVVFSVCGVRKTTKSVDGAYLFPIEGAMSGTSVDATTSKSRTW